MFVNAARAVEVEHDQKVSNNSKSVASIEFTGTKGSITFPLALEFPSTVVQEEGANQDVTTMKILKQYGGNLQIVDLYSHTGGKCT